MKTRRLIQIVPKVGIMRIVINSRLNNCISSNTSQSQSRILPLLLTNFSKIHKIKFLANNILNNSYSLINKPNK